MSEWKEFEEFLDELMESGETMEGEQQMESVGTNDSALANVSLAVSMILMPFLRLKKCSLICRCQKSTSRATMAASCAVKYSTGQQTITAYWANKQIGIASTKN
jgi:hypothetical protein